ncbi:MAG: site-specific integrase [Proteobacteria bacterium]|nr:site-specific integrase [Pseudomonadota bacterium]
MSEVRNPRKDKAVLWQKTATPNLIRNSASGTFYARFRLGGKLRWQSLATKSLTTAKLKLADTIKAERQLVVAGDGQITFAQAAALYRERMATDPKLKAKTKVDHEQRFARLMKTITGKGGSDTALAGVAREDRARIQEAERKEREAAWAAWGTVKIRAIPVAQCEEWSRKLRAAYAGATTFNKTLACLREILDIGIEKGARFDNPAKAKSIGREKESPKALRLPEPDQFERFVAAVENSGSGWSKPCADLVRFLAFTGLRIGEARFVTWADVNFTKGKMTVRGNPETGLKHRNVGESRDVPLIPEARVLLEKLRANRADEPDDRPVMEVFECQRAMDSAAAKVGMERISHHDLRHLFATRCIESGVDIPTVSRWMGHKDGGALAMRTYGHLRDTHSAEMARKVTFATATPANVVKLESGVAA